MRPNYLAVIRLGRPQNTRVPVLLLGLYALLYHISLTNFILLSIIYIAAYQVITAVNNIYDKDIDADNKLKINPLAAGSVTKDSVESYIVVSTLVAVSLLFILANQALYLTMLGAAAFGVWYSYPKTGLAYRHYSGTAVLAFWYGALPIVMAGLFYGKVDYYSSSAFALLFVPLLLAKDYRDITGDKMAGKITPLLRYGKRNIVAVSFVCFVISSGMLLCIARSPLLAPALLSYWVHVKRQHDLELQVDKLYIFLSLICLLVAVYFTTR